MGKMPGRPPGESSGGGGRTAAGRAARRVAEGQHDSSGGAPDEAVPRVAPPEELAGYVTVRICGEIAAGEKERANEWCEVFVVPQGGRSCGWPGNEPAGGDCRLCHSSDLQRNRSGRKTGERMVRGFFQVPQGGRSCGWPGDEPAGRREETVSCPSAGRRPRINQKCAEYSRVKQWDGSPPPNCGEENENGA